MVKTVTSKMAERRRADRAFAEDPAAILEAVAQIKSDELRAAQIEKNTRMMSVVRKVDRFKRYDANPTDEASALQSFTIGKEGSGHACAKSSEALIYAEQDRLLSPLDLELERAGVLKEIRRGDRDLDLAISKEMARLNGGVDLATGNSTALKIAGVLNKYIDLGRERRNAQGAYTREMPGFIVPQSHNPGKVRGKGKPEDFETWKTYIAERLDERTFDSVDPTPEARADWFKNEWNALSTGVHLKAGESDWLGGFTGGSQNVAKRASQERSLHFKDAQSWFEYNEKFGNGSLFETVSQHLKNVGRDVGLMKVWGPNPRAAFEADRQQLIARAFARGDQDQVMALSGKTMAGKLALSAFDQVDGSANITENASMAAWGRNIRGIETITKLVNGVLSQFGDLWSRSGTMRWNGQAPLETHAQSIAALLKGRPDLEQREILHRIGGFGDGVIGDIAARVSAGDKLDGRMAKWVRWSQIANGQRWWTDVMSAQTTRDLSTTLGFYRESSFGDLPGKLKDTLGRYGITEQHWDYARANTLEHNGRHLTVSDAIRYESDDVVMAMMGKTDATPTEIARFKDDFEQTWRTYYIDQTREAITDPGAMTRAAITGGLQPGTVTGEAMRFIMQFKAFPIAFIQKQINRDLNRGASADLSGLLQLFFGMTAAGYLSGAAKDLIRNKTPKTADDPSDWIKLFTDSVARGGGLGILGDVLFNDYNRNGGSSAANLLGPTVGDAGEMFGLLQAFASEGAGTKDTNLSAKTLNLVSNHLPVVNLWYLKGAYETLILHGLQESVNPGYLGRQQRKMDRDWGQHYILAPTVW